MSAAERERARRVRDTRAHRIPVAVLGATGAVGQTFVRLLEGHPWFQLTEVAASERSVGRRYGEAAHWLEGELPRRVAALRVLECTPEAVGAPIVFSALDSSVAGAIELAFARAGRTVLTNARNHRMEPDVPLVIPEVNPDHLGLLAEQRARRGWTGGIVANGNCSSIVITLALAPLHEAFGIRTLFVTTLQALSGAGYPGVSSLDAVGNVVPYIGGGEEEKIETEPLKMLGELVGGEGSGGVVGGGGVGGGVGSGALSVVPATFAVSAQVTRVPVEHGHTACMAVELERGASVGEVLEALRSWGGSEEARSLPSAPERAVVVTEAVDRPQPRRDAAAGGGMTVTVGRVRRDPILDVRLVASGHNTIRGAAGAALLNAELITARTMTIPTTNS